MEGKEMDNNRMKSMNTEQEEKPDDNLEEHREEAETARNNATDDSAPNLFGDSNMEIDDASWSEVFQTCCCHSPQDWLYIIIGLVMLCFFLYFFLLGLDLLGSSAKVIGGCTAGTLLGDDTNPIAALMIGILATVLLQSSSTTTSIVVSLVGSEAIPTRQAIYMVMGANIGTSVTNTIVAMGQMGDGDQLERAFSGATVHDMFNFLTVAILLPVEAATGYLYRLTEVMVSEESVSEGEKWTGPVKKIVSPLSNKIIVANKKLIEEVAKTNKTCANFYPISCENDSNPTKSTCKKVGLIGCDKTSGECPAFFSPKASRSDDEVSGGVCFVISLVILVICLIGLVTILQKMLLGMSTRIIYKATNINGYLAMLVGVGITILVQSSSITTSTLTPLVGMGVLQLEAMLPLTLGANIGTTVTALLASLVSDSVNSLQVALAHLFFNISGILIWYPLPFMRQVPLNAARNLGKATRIWRGFPILYIIVMFFIVPLLLLGLASLFEQGTVGFQVLGAFLTILIFCAIMYFVYFWFFRGGKQQCIDCLENRQRKAATMKDLPDDMEFLKAKMLAISERIGLEDDEEFQEGEDWEGQQGEEGVQDK